MSKAKKLKKDLSEHGLVGIDTNVFVRHFEGGEPASLTEAALTTVEEGTCEGAVSPLTIAELLARPLEMGREGVADLYRVMFHEMPNLRTVPVDTAVAERAAELSAAYGLDTGQAVRLAGSLVAGATAYLTEDSSLKEVREIKVMMLDEYY